MKYEIKYTTRWHEAQELAAEGWRLVAVSPWKDVDGYDCDGIYFERKQKVKPKKKK